MIVTVPLSGKVFNSDQLRAELIAAGQQVTGSPGLYVAGNDLVITGDDLSQTPCAQVLAAHVPPTSRRPRKEADIAADLEAELLASGIGKPTAKRMARLIARQEMLAPGSMAAQGYTTPTTEVIP